MREWWPICLGPARITVVDTLCSHGTESLLFSGSSEAGSETGVSKGGAVHASVLNNFPVSRFPGASSITPHRGRTTASTTGDDR